MVTTYTNQNKNTSSYSNGTKQTSSFTNQAKTATIEGIAYNSSYAYNNASVSYAGIASYANFTNQTKN